MTSMADDYDAYWLDQRVDEMSREELIVALKYCAAKLAATQRDAICQNAVWRELLQHSRRRA